MLEIKEQRPVSPLWPLIGFAVAALFGFVVLPLAARGSFSELSGNSAYRSWQVLVVLQASLWIFSAAYVIRVWRSMRAGRPLTWPSWVAVLLLGALTVLPYVIDSFYISFDWSQSKAVPRGYLALALGILASMIVGAGIIRIHGLANDGLSSNKLGLTTYREISLYLERHLLLLGGILAGAVIGSAAFREAVYCLDGAYPFAAEQIWQLAVYWSALLAVVYVTARNSVRHIGYRLREALLSKSEPGKEGADRLKQEDELGKLLGLSRGYVAELQSVASVLIPIAGAIASQLLPSGL